MTDYRAPAVGASASLSRTIGEEDIELFTRISGDRNPLHDDREVAERLPGPGTVFLSVARDFRAAASPGDTVTGRVQVTAGGRTHR